MSSNLSFFISYLILYHLIVKSSQFVELKKELTVCQDYSVLLRNDNNYATVVDVINGNIVNLLCRFW